MKNKSPTNNPNSLPFRQPGSDRGPGNSHELGVPAAGLDRSGTLENTLRWEDDGGPVLEAGNPLPQLAEINTPRTMVARRVG